MCLAATHWRYRFAIRICGRHLEYMFGYHAKGQMDIGRLEGSTCRLFVGLFTTWSWVHASCRCEIEQTRNQCKPWTSHIDIKQLVVKVKSELKRVERYKNFTIENFPRHQSFVLEYDISSPLSGWLKVVETTVLKSTEPSRDRNVTNKIFHESEISLRSEFIIP